MQQDKPMNANHSLVYFEGISKLQYDSVFAGNHSSWARKFLATNLVDGSSFVDFDDVVLSTAPAATRRLASSSPLFEALPDSKVSLKVLLVDDSKATR